MTLIDFLCKRGLNFKFLIFDYKRLPVELIEKKKMNIVKIAQYFVFKQLHKQFAYLRERMRKN